MLIFYLERHERLFRKKKRINQMQIFYQNHGLTPWQKANFCSVLLQHFYHLEKLIFYLEHHERLFPDLFDLKNTG